MQRVVPLLLLTLTLVACSDDTSVVEQTPQWTLRETLRIGSGDEGPTSFSWVKGIAEGADGRIYIYEHSTQDIRVFNADGSFDRTIGRRGAGPGELRNAEGIVFASDGTLWVSDASNARFSRFDADGTALESWPMNFCSSQGTWAPFSAADGIVDDDCIPGVDPYKIVRYRIDRSGVDSLGMVAECGTQELNEAATWITKEGTATSYRQIPWAPRAVSAYDATGATWCAPSTGRYELLRIALGGTDTVRVVRNVDALPVNAAERDSAIALIESRGPTGVDFSRIPSVKPSIHRLTIDDQNRLWVRRDRAEGGIVFDIFESDGKQAATVTLGTVRTPVWSPFVVRGDVVLLVTTDDDDVPQVGRFVIERGG
jgi:hypothetical protein